MEGGYQEEATSKKQKDRTRAAARSIFIGVVVFITIHRLVIVNECTSAVSITQRDRLVQPETTTDVATLMIPDEGLDPIHSKITDA
jgi:hypothetical protein